MSERIYEMLDVLALSCAIQRSKGKYVGVQTVWDGKVDEHTSKDILFFYLVPGTSPEGFVPNVKVTDDDKQQANEIIKFYRKLTFGVLAENVNDYLKSISRILGNSEITIKDFGIISSIPNTYERDVIRSEKDKIIKQTQGEIFGNVGDSVNLFCCLIDIHFIKSIECFAHVAVDSQGRLIEFLNKKQLGFENDNIQIKAKIKGHSNHYQTKKPLTQLNYVKVIHETY